MLNFKEKFLKYCNYINYNGKDKNYVYNCQEYRKVFLESLEDADICELPFLIKEYQFAIHMEDGFELYKRYFELGGRDEKVLKHFLEYLWFWGDFDDVIPKIEYIIESKNNNELNKIINSIIDYGIDELQKN